MKKREKIELLAPAGNIEKMRTALEYGADAVYAGVPDFSLRVRINDFTFSRLKQAAAYCHKRGKKIYVTINIFAHNHHLEKVKRHIKRLKEIRVDGLIVSDPGILETVRSVWPKAEIHLSTQANCTNWQSAKFWHRAGADRIILGREVTLEEIKEIHKKVPALELEYFIHGAMCMAYSGRCFLSKLFAGRSANLGDCSQPCRWPYLLSAGERRTEELKIVEEEHGTYILNSKDLCLLEYLPQLIDAGVTSLKIEGRAKSAYYIAVVTRAYGQALAALAKSKEEYKKTLPALKNELVAKLVHRGYTTGFLLGGKGDQNLSDSHQHCAWEYCGQVTKSLKTKSGKYQIFIRVHNSLKVKDNIEIVRPAYDIITLRIKNLFNGENNEKITEAHGGQGKVVVMEIEKEIPAFSVIRRKITRKA